MMKHGYFSTFDTNYIADQLVLEVSDYAREKRRRAASNLVNLTHVDERIDTAADESKDESAAHDEENRGEGNPDDSTL